MIEGLRIRMPAAELRAHCIDRSAYHDKRAQEKAEQLPKLREALTVVRGTGTVTSAPIAHANKGGYHLDPDDPVKDLERDINDHKNKTLTFAFFADHLFDEDYNLKEDDLVRLELLKR